MGALFITLFLRLLGAPRRFLAAGLSTLLIAVYVVLVGADAAVVRAAVMGGLSLFARQLGRRQDGLNSLGIVAGVMALFDPHVPWDVGFQLSFAATLGLILYAEPLTKGFIGWAARWLPLPTAMRLASPVSEYFLLTFAAQVTTLPVIVYHFRRFSLVSLLANPVILPAQPAVMILGGIAVLLGMAVFPLGRIAAALAWPFVLFTIRAVEAMARWPGGDWYLGPVAWVIPLVFYLLLFGWTAWGAQLRAWLAAGSPAQPGRWSRLANAGIFACGAAALLVWHLVWQAPDGRLHLTLLDVGGGEALLIRTPGGRAVLIDGGPSPSALSDGLGRRLPFTRPGLDCLVVANPDESHVAALPAVILRHRPELVLWAGATHADWSARRLQAAFAESGLRPHLLQGGEALDLGDGAQLSAVLVSSRGAVLLLEWRAFRALLPLGLDGSALEQLPDAANLGPLTALLLAESGYAPANPPEWIRALAPEVALLSVAADDYEGLPSAETLQAVEDYTLLRTDRDGWIELVTDGETMWVEVEKR